MKTTLLAALTLCAALWTISSCNKNKNQEDIKIEILSPADGAVFNSGDTLALKVTASDNDDLHEMKLEIRQGANIALGLYPYVHAIKSYTIDTLIVIPPVSGTQIYSLEAAAEDHESHTAEDIISITVNP